MNKAGFIRSLLVSMLCVGLAGCGDLSSGTGQGKGVAGAGLSGASVGSATSQGPSGAPAGAMLAPGASYVIERSRDEISGGNQKEAVAEKPISVLAGSALQAPTADLNGDGYVTLEEVLAMKDAGLTDDEMLERLRATKQVFEPTIAQQDYLRNHGISNNVIEQMLGINGGERQQLLKAPGGGRSNPPGSVISLPPPEPSPPPAPP